jgi:hypothetical protein
MQAAPTYIQVTQPNWFKRHFEFLLKEQPMATLDHVKWGAEQSPYIKLHIPTKWICKMAVSLDTRHTWHFRGTGFWKRTWSWFDERGNLVIAIKSNMISRKNRGSIVFHQPVNNNLLMLMALGWYTVVAYEQQAAASSAA